jgi:uncharacterized protein
MSNDPFIVPITGLRRTPGALRHERRQGVISGSDGPGRPLAVSGSHVAVGAPVLVDVDLLVVDGGVVVAGEVRARWEGDCRRCLRPVSGEVAVDVRELYRQRHPGEAPDSDEETYPLGADTLDLRPLARDAVLLNLPLAPLCGADCAGLCPVCGADRNDGGCACPPPAADPRWAALDVLRDPGAP